MIRPRSKLRSFRLRPIWPGLELPDLGHSLARVALLGSLAACGCDCEGEAEAAPVGEAPSSEVPAAELVPTSELPGGPGGEPPGPAITVEASPRGYRASNRSLVASWAEVERARVTASAPPERPGFPIVEVVVPLLDDGAPLLVPGLRDALSSMLVAERTRGAEAPRRVVLRASTSLRWARAARVIVSARAAGLDELGIVLGSGEEENVLVVSSPAGAAPAHAPLDLGAAVRALGTAPALPAGVPEAAASGAAPGSAATLSVSLEEHGLRVRRGTVELGAGCHAPSTDGSPAIPRTALPDGHTLSDCLAAAPAGTTSFTSGPEVSFGAAVRVLAALSTRGPVEIPLD